MPLLDRLVYSWNGTPSAPVPANGRGEPAGGARPPQEAPPPPAPRLSFERSSERPEELSVARVAVEPPSDLYGELKSRVHERLIRDLDPAKLNSTQDRETLRRSVEDAAGSLLAGEETNLTRAQRVRLVTEVADEILGYGPLEPLLRDPTVTEVMVNGPRHVYFERGGLIYLSDRCFRDDDHIMRIVQRIVGPLGRRIDESSPMVDARLPDGSRVNVIIPPLSVKGPSITIRKFSRIPYSADDLVRFNTLSPAMVTLLRACIVGRLNIVISGGTGTGKTTLLNMLSSYIPHHERIVTIEDPAELQLAQENWVSLETRPANMEGKGEVVQRELTRNALRMRPDRIIIGECRAGEAFDMLQAMNTGHEGSLTTVHANSPRDALSRIENMVLMANLDLPARAIREQIASAIHLIVHLTRMRDGVRRVTQMTEIVGMEGQVITTHDIFVYETTGVDRDGRLQGRFRPTGLRPHFLDRIGQAGIALPTDLFVPHPEPAGSAG